jgi:hypothetical protein
MKNAKIGTKIHKKNYFSIKSGPFAARNTISTIFSYSRFEAFSWMKRKFSRIIF